MYKGAIYNGLIAEVRSALRWVLWRFMDKSTRSASIIYITRMMILYYLN